MKRRSVHTTLLTAAAALLTLLALACERLPETDGPAGTRKEIRLSIPASASVRDLQILEFRVGVPWRDAYYHTTDPLVEEDGVLVLPETATLRSGDERIVVVLNGPACDTIGTYSQWRNSSYTLGSSDRPDREILLYGETVAEGGAFPSLRLGRMVGRVVVSSIENRLQGGYGIDSLYLFLANARASVRFGEAFSSDARRLNPGGLLRPPPDEGPAIDGTAGREAAAWTCARSGALAYGHETETPAILYSCPVDTEDGHPLWLVVGAWTGGRIRYYNLAIGGIGKNASLDVSLILRLPGADTPCTPHLPGTFSTVLSPVSVWTTLDFETNI